MKPKSFSLQFPEDSLKRCPTSPIPTTQIPLKEGFYTHISSKTFAKSPKIYLNLLQKNLNDTKTQKETLLSNLPKLEPTYNEESRFLYQFDLNNNKNNCWTNILNDFLKKPKKKTENKANIFHKKQRKVNYSEFNLDFMKTTFPASTNNQKNHKRSISNYQNFAYHVPQLTFQNIDKPSKTHNRFYSSHSQNENSIINHTEKSPNTFFKVKKLSMAFKTPQKITKNLGLLKKEVKSDGFKGKIKPLDIKKIHKSLEEKIMSPQTLSPWDVNSPEINIY